MFKNKKSHHSILMPPSDTSSKTKIFRKSRHVKNCWNPLECSETQWRLPKLGALFKPDSAYRIYKFHKIAKTIEHTNLNFKIDYLPEQQKEGKGANIISYWRKIWEQWN